MVISIKDAEKKYEEYILAINNTKDGLLAHGFQIDTSDEFELGGEWLVLLEDRAVAKVTWNIPYYIEFTPIVSQREKSFLIDYIKNFNDWNRLLNNITVSILEIKNK